MKWLLAPLFALVSLAALAQSPEDVQRLADEIVPEPVRHLALTDQEAMIEAWVAHDVELIRQRMVGSGADEAQVAVLLDDAAASFREIIEADWYGRLESLPNRDPRFSDLTDRDLLDLAQAAEAEGQVCERADYLTEFHGRNVRARAERLAEVTEAQQACRDAG